MAPVPQQSTKRPFPEFSQPISALPSVPLRVPVETINNPRVKKSRKDIEVEAFCNGAPAG
jgi:hypothetical protein